MNPDSQRPGRDATFLYVECFLIEEAERLLRGPMRFGDAERFARINRAGQRSSALSLACSRVLTDFAT